MTQILWSPLARGTYMATLDEIAEKWSVKAAEKFEKKVDSLIEKLSSFPNLCPPSTRFPERRKCAITNQTSLVYEIEHDTITLLVFEDARSTRFHS